MSKSPKEEFRDTSAIVQNNLYYEEGTLELFLELVKKYRKQSTKYDKTTLLFKFVVVLLWMGSFADIFRKLCLVGIFTRS